MTMKTKSYLILAAAALTMGSCDSSDGFDPNAPVAAQVTAGVSGPATRAMDDVWEADEIGVMVTDAPNSDMETMYRNVRYATTATTASAANFSSDAPVYFEDATEVVTFSAYGPYQPALGADGKVAVNTAAQGTRDAQRAFDFIYASGAKASKSQPVVEFKKVSEDENHQFAHRMTRLVIIVKAGDGITPAQVKAAAVTLGGLAHEGTFDVTSGDATATGSAVADWTLSASSLRTETDNDVTFTSILLPQTLAAALTFKATVDGNNFVNSDAINPALKAGMTYTYTITVKKTGLEVSGCSIEPWGEGGSGSGNAELQ